MRIVTRPDYDGIVCAVLLIEALGEPGGIEWVEPGDMQKRRVPITPEDIIANLPHHPDAAMWFDHHQSNRPDHPVAGLFAVAPSAAGLIYRYYRDRLGDRFNALVASADKIDSADLSMEEVRWPERYPDVLLSMTINGQNASDRPYWNHLVDLLRRVSVKQAVDDPLVADRCRRTIADNAAYDALLREHTRLTRHVAVTDFTSFQPAPTGNRFLVYALFPDATVSVRIRRHETRDDMAVISVGHNIFNPGCRVSAGLLMKRHGGGGHFGAGAGNIPLARLSDCRKQIIDVLVANEPIDA